MGLEIEYIDGQTPLNDEEKDGLRIRSITTRIELDEFEQLNIEKAIEWSFHKKFNKEQTLNATFVKKLHKQIFSDVWTWAGEFRKSNKNIGVDWHIISVQLKQLLDDCQFWIEHKSYNDEEIAIRFKHRLVNIHCFSNGNGRHSRLIADLIMKNIFNKPEFTWSKSHLVKQSDARKNYIDAIRTADGDNIVPLLKFAKS
jgi:Fic-DOC domain mobile mystery protein B